MIGKREGSGRERLGKETGEETERLTHHDWVSLFYVRCCRFQEEHRFLWHGVTQLSCMGPAEDACRHRTYDPRYFLHPIPNILGYLAS